MSALLRPASDLGIRLGLLVLFIPPAAELVIEGKDGCVKLFAAYRRGVSVEVLGNCRWRDWCRRPDHADVLARSTDVGIRLKYLSDDTIDLW